MNNARDNVKEASQLLIAALDETLTDQQHGRLAELLDADPDVRDMYVQHMTLHTYLEQLHSPLVEDTPVPDDGLLLLEQEDTFEEGLTGVQDKPSTPQVPNSVRISFMTNFDWRVHPIMFIAGVTALGGVFWALIFALVWQTVYQPNVAQNGIDKDAPIVATYSKNHDAEWDCDPADVPMLGLPFYRGEVVKLKSGLVEMEFKSGAEVTLEGPCEFTFHGKNIGNLRSGKLVAYVRERAKGFTIVTPHAKIVDLGTEFGVEVDKEGDTHAQVFQVVFEVRPGKGETRTLAAGEAVQVSPRGKIALKPFDKERFAQERFKIDLAPGKGITRLSGAIRLLNAPPRTLVTNQFENSSNIVIFRERQGVLLSHDLKVDIAEPGSGDIGKHTGGRLAAGLRVDSYLLHFDAPDGKKKKIAQLQGKVTFDRPVLGIIAMSAGLFNTDKLLGAKETRYDEDNGRGIETKDAKDVITLSDDRRTVHVNLKLSGAGLHAFDQIRVLVTAAPNDSQSGDSKKGN